MAKSVPTYNGFPVRDADAVEYICKAIRALAGETGSVTDIVRSLGHADRDGPNNSPTMAYHRVRAMVLLAEKRGRVVRMGKKLWGIAQRKVG